jgi:hypothetical protein
MYHIDVKYMLLASSRLRNFKQKNDHLWNASCPICGDSKKKVTKSRLYFFRHKGDLFVKCWNCQYSGSFSRFLKHIDPIAHKDYTYEKYLNEHPDQSVTTTLASNVQPERSLEMIRESLELSIPSILELDKTHPAKAYIASRKIPERYWSQLY